MAGAEGSTPAGYPRGLNPRRGAGICPMATWPNWKEDGIEFSEKRRADKEVFSQKPMRDAGLRSSTEPLPAIAKILVQESNGAKQR